MMELGSEYNLSLKDLNLVSDNIFKYLSEFDNCYYFDSGRSALKHIARHLFSFPKILLPEFICESVTNCFEKSKIEYYKLKDDFSVDIESLRDKIRNEPAVIFLMHYFGSLQPASILETIRLVADRTGSIIIEDTTHSVFTQKITVGDYLVCSIRKWLPISGGGVLYYNRDLLNLVKPDYRNSTNNCRSYGMILKDLFLNNGFDCNSEYRRIFSDCEKRLDEQHEIYEISDLSRFIASCISVEEMMETRRRNFQQFDEAMRIRGIKPVVHYNSTDTPLVYPIRSKRRDDLRSYLMSNRIYCAVHWPFDYHKLEQRPFAKKNADELISLPLDQRYGKAHIQYMIDVIQQYGGDLLF